MARTRASVAAKVATGKSSKARCDPAPPPAGSSSSGSGGEKSKNHSGGNPVCPRETPKWQKPITNFFTQNQPTTKSDDEDTPEVEAGSSKSKPKRNVIHSDDEEEIADRLKNSELGEPMELEPLDGEESHKMDEYYTAKDKGTGKTSNSNRNIKYDFIEKKKRILDELNSTSEKIENINKKVKV